MARVTVEDCLEKVENRFLLVMLAAKRVKQLYKGSKPLIENKADNKNVVISLREIASGSLSYEMTSRKSR
jgi:DNA-directed RNA polymerase subunit omega